MSCPCCSGKAYEACCEPYLKGDAIPATPEALMRSRYSAFVHADIDYIINTHDPAGRDDLDRESNLKWARDSEWLGLEVLRTEAGGPEDDTGVVEFVARYRQGGTERRHHEISTFTRKEDRWYFSDGHPPKPETFIRQEAKIGRNDPCPCGSGKKYKKCCLRGA